MTEHNLVETFLKRAKAVQCEVVTVKDWNGVCEKLVETVRKCDARSLVVSGFDEETTELINSHCSGEGINCFMGTVRDQLPGFPVAVTPGHAGISETGTVIIESTSEDVRLASMLADHHIIVLSSSALYPELQDVEPLLDRLLQDGSAYIGFITGPSRTADVERVLTIGVHGPRKVTIILYGE